MSEEKCNPYLKYFVKETQPKSKNQFLNLDKNSRKEYEEVIATTKSRKALYREKHRLRKRKLLNPSTNINNDELSICNPDKQDVKILFQAVTHDSVESIEQILLNNEFDVNTRDQYQWTPLMRACHRGDTAIIKLLLQKGAKLNVKDAAGNGPLSITRQCNHADACKLIEEILKEQFSLDQQSVDVQSKSEVRVESNVVNESRDIRGTSTHSRETKDKKQPSAKLNLSDEKMKSEVFQTASDSIQESATSSQRNTRNSKSVVCICISSSDSEGESTMVYCELCNMNVKDKSHKEHLLSTVHQFYKQMKANESNEEKLIKPVRYEIPEENRGFQLLLKSGWTKQRGLGKRETGIRAPIRTKTKLDRKGIGKKKETAKLHKVLPELNVKFNPALRKEIEKNKELVYRKELSGS